MTPARQERKSHRLLAVLAAALGIAAGFAGIAAGAATTEWVVVNRYTGLAIDGFDPVTYFVDGVPKQGSPELELRAHGATWRFCNEGNRAAFAADPDVYAPRFGGHDPVAVARGVATAGYPVLWLIVEKQLYFFYSDGARSAFSHDPANIVAVAERNWAAVRHTLVRN
jgi:YHS domain-containing protein